MLDQLSEVMFGWSKFYIVEIMQYTLACMIMLEDFPEGKGKLVCLLFVGLYHSPLFTMRLQQLTMYVMLLPRWILITECNKNWI